LPNIAPDLVRLGFRFPQAYDELLIDPSLFHWDAEQRRQQMLFAEWKRQLPAACRGRVAAEVGRWTDATLPHLYLATSAAPLRPVPFSRLTLTAQLEVLSQPVARSWDLCTPLNSFLIPWRQRAQGGKLQVTPWPSRAANWLSGRAYAERFVKA